MAQGPAKVTIKLKIAGHVASKGKAGQGAVLGAMSGCVPVIQQGNWPCCLRPWKTQYL